MAIKPLVLTDSERMELQRRMRSRALRADDCKRARVILELAGGRGLRATANHLACSTSYVQRWAGRFRSERMNGLFARHPGRTAAKGAATLEARILEWTRRGPHDGTTQWSSRRLAKKLGTTHMAVARVWSRYALQPHRPRTPMIGCASRLVNNFGGTIRVGIEHQSLIYADLHNSQQYKPLRSFLNVCNTLTGVLRLQELFWKDLLQFSNLPRTIATLLFYWSFISKVYFDEN